MPGGPGGGGAPGARSEGAPGGAAAAAAAAGPGREGSLELAEARRRLLEAEGRRRLVSELEGRVVQLHRVFLEAEVRLAGRAESLGRLGGGVAQAELYLAAHGQRLKKTLRRSKRIPAPPLLASALRLAGCVPWAARRLRRGRGAATAAPTPDSPCKRGRPAASTAAAAPPPLPPSPQPPGGALP